MRKKATEQPLRAANAAQMGDRGEIAIRDNF